MTSFDRTIPAAGMDALLGGGSRGCPPWFEQLLSKWRPAGQDSGDDGLRLAIRNGYLNFYRRGQSVARVCFGRQFSPRVEVHIKYVHRDAGPGQQYARLDTSGLSCVGYGRLAPYEGVRTLEGWIAKAQTYAGAEKRFVDRVLSYNANVIDLEMGLPATSKGGTAPRMDIVVLEKVASEHRVVFWEAKLMSDGRLRKRDPQEPPEVLEQLENYRAWMATEGHPERVARAYKRTCELLVELHARAKSVNPEIGELGDAIRSVAASHRPPLIDPDPRLLIEDSLRSASWARHAPKLGQTRLHHIRADEPRSFQLPGLA